MREGLLSLQGARAELIKRYGYAPSYQQLWNNAGSRFPAERTPGPGWFISPADIPAIAKAFGMKRPRLEVE